MPIDTDDLSKKTYRAVMVEAERFDHNLTLQFGLLSYQCKDETEFIKKSKLLIKEMLTYDEEEIEETVFGIIQLEEVMPLPDKKKFHRALRKIISNLNEI